MLETKQVTVKTQKGEEKTYTISKVPATVGRELVAVYPVSAMPKIGEYKTNHQMMLKMMSYVSVDLSIPGGATVTQYLNTEAMVNNHVPDWECLGRLEMEMIEYNFSFFGNGGSSNFLKNLPLMAEAFITKILMASSARSSQKEKQPSTN